jgi:hypothetical protein
MIESTDIFTSANYFLFYSSLKMMENSDLMSTYLSSNRNQLRTWLVDNAEEEWIQGIIDQKKKKEIKENKEDEEQEKNKELAYFKSMTLLKL